MSFDPIAINQLREKLIEIRDEELNDGHMQKALYLSHAIAVLHDLLKEI